jgi:hypothetical protein
VTSGPAHRQLSTSRRRALGGVAVVRALVVALALAVGTADSAQAALDVRARASEENGYARLILQFDQMPSVQARLSNGVLVLTFSEPVSLAPDKLALALANYVSAARVDPDGKAFRLALSRRVTVRSMAAGQRYFVDLLPEGWIGEPPSLPQDVIDELTAQAREAERLAREEAARRARARPTPIVIRMSRQPTFARLTFDLTAPVPVAVERKGDDVTVTFDAALSADARLLKAQLPPQLKDIKTSDKDARLTVTMKVAKGADIRAFWDGPQYVVDLTGVGESAEAADIAAKLEEAAKAAAAQPTPGETVLEGEKPTDAAPEQAKAADAHGADHATPSETASSGSSEVKAPETEKAKDTHTAKADTPHDAAADHAVEAGVKTAEAATAPGAETPKSEKEHAASAGVAAEGAKEEHASSEHGAAAQTPAVDALADAGGKPAEGTAGDVPSGEPAATVAESGDSIRPIVQMVGETVRIALPFERKTPAAIFRRGDNLWMVFGTDRAIDAEPVAAQAGAVIAGAEAFPADSAMVLRINLAKTPLTTVSTDANTWVVSIGDLILDAAVPVPLTRSVKSNGRTIVVAPLEGIGGVHRLKDPDVGDELVVVTASAPARAFLKPQDFVEFQTLVTAHGLAFSPKADDVVFAPEIDRVVIGRDAGLTLSAAGAAASAKPKAQEKRIALLDAAQWAKESEQPFRERERELLHTVAAATEGEATPARIALARFYLAKGFGAEALGTLRNALAADVNAARDPEFAILSAISSIDLGHGGDALKTLADNGLSDSADGTLWRAVAESVDNQWGPAREAFQRGAAAIDLYPPALQARFRLVGYQAALEANDAAEADQQRQAFEALGVDIGMGPHKALLDARLAEMQGRQAEALEAYRVAIEGPDAVASAEARLRSAGLRRELGQIDDKAVLDELETLAAVWRGDDIEARTLKALAEEHIKAGRYREAFAQLKTALIHHNGSPSTRELQDKLTEKFVALFLDGEADTLPPIEALSLFYDYRELTPVDRRGDEMIRKLADRLVEVDLLSQAAELLQHQVDHRLSGAGRAQVAARLAMIQLMNRKPSLALKALATTRQAELPRELVRARLVLEARALAETARPDLALEILDQIEGDESVRLRADVLWQARRWREAGEAIEFLLGDSWESATPLDDDQRLQALRAAIAYSLAEDKIGLDRLRSKFTAKMANSADAATFETVSAPIDARGVAFREVAKAIAATDTLDAFIKDYRKRHDPAAPAAPAAVPPKPSASAEPATTPAG